MKTLKQYQDDLNILKETLEDKRQIISARVAIKKAKKAIKEATQNIADQDAIIEGMDD